MRCALPSLQQPDCRPQCGFAVLKPGGRCRRSVPIGLTSQHGRERYRNNHPSRASAGRLSWVLWQFSVTHSQVPCLPSLLAFTTDTDGSLTFAKSFILSPHAFAFHLFTLFHASLGAKPGNQGARAPGNQEATQRSEASVQHERTRPRRALPPSGIRRIIPTLLLRLIIGGNHFITLRSLFPRASFHRPSRLFGQALLPPPC